jgi:hypothetical protein
MEQAARYRQQQLGQFLVQQELHLDRSVLKVQRQVGQLLVLAVQQVQPVQEQAEQQEA